MNHSLNKPTLDIGIPAYNEENNIKSLINILLDQNRNIYRLNNIYIVSDASTDQTSKIIRKYPSKIIKPIVLKVRRGQSNAQNEILKRADADLLLLLNADTRPKSKNFIDKLVREIKNDAKNGIVSPLTESLPPKGFIERVVISGRLFKLDAYKKWKNGNNVFLCHGRSRLIVKDIYKHLRFPDLCPEDAYSYFYCISMGYNFRFTGRIVNTFKSPQTFADYRKQSNRFFSGKNNLKKYFHTNMIDKEYDIPVGVFIRSFVENIVKFHFYLVTYFFLLGISVVTNKYKFSSLWSDISTSKKI